MKTATKTRGGVAVFASVEDRYEPALPVKAIVPSPHNPRQTFDEAKLQELAESIQAHGVLEPILVRPLAGDHGDVFELVAGERRLRACELAGVKTVPARIRSLGDLAAAELRLVENLQREDLDALEEAAGYQRLLDEHGLTIEDLVRKVGKSESYIYGTLKLRNTPPAAAEAFRQGRLSKNHLILLGRIPNEQARDKAAERMIQPSVYDRDELSFRQAREMVERDFMIQLKGACFDRKSLTLVPAAGSCEACPKRTGNNRRDFPEGRADVCTDPGCFRAKEAAHRRAAVERAEVKGVKVLPAEKAKRLFSEYSDDGMAYDSPYCDLARQCPDDGKHRSYKQLVGAELAAETVAAVDPKGRLHYLVPKERAAEVLAAQGIGAGTRNGKGAGDYSRTWKRQQQARAAVYDAWNRAVWRAVRDAFAGTVGLNVGRLPAIFRNLVERHAECSQGDRNALTDVLDVAEQRDDEDGPAFFARLLDGRPAYQLAAMLAFMLFQEIGWSSALDTVEVNEAAELLGIDLKQVKADAKAALKAAKKPAAKEPEAPAEATPDHFTWDQAERLDPCAKLSDLLDGLSEVVVARLRAAKLVTAADLGKWLSESYAVPGELARLRRIADVPGLTAAQAAKVEAALSSALKKEAARCEG